MQVAIIGAGASGLAAMNILAARCINVDVYSNNVGGDYLSGGLKYIHYNPYVEKFLGEEMGSGFYWSKINGALVGESGLCFYPEILWRASAVEVDKFRREYATKTGRAIQTDEINYNFLFNPNHVYDKESLKIIPKLGLAWFMDLMKFRLSTGIVNGKKCVRHFKFDVDSKKLKEIIQDYDYVVYTAPINFLLKTLEIPFHFNYSQLHISRYRVTNHISKIWWDYAYVPLLKYFDQEIPFYRLSQAKLSDTEVYLDVELPISFENNLKNSKWVNTLLGFFARRYLLMPEARFEPLGLYPISIKGNFNYKESISHLLSEIPENIFLLGRFAQWDRRVVLASVIQRIYKEILPKIV